jgi:lysozyme
VVTVLDISNVQGAVDWQRVAAAGDVHAVYAKATEGRSFSDGRFGAYRRDARRHGLHVGAYHFARPDHNHPADEANHFLEVLGGGLHSGELVPALDLEVPAHGVDLVAWAREFNRVVHEHLGVWPLFYSYSSYIVGLRAKKPIGGGLWLAAYSRNDGKEHPFAIPAPWRHVRLHQFTSQARHPGIGGKVDISHGPSLEPLLITGV